MTAIPGDNARFPKAVLKRETRKNISVEAVVAVYKRLLNFAVSIVLARLLIPEDFGVVSIVGMLLGYVLVVQGLGVSTALIRERKDVASASSAAFKLRAILAVVQLGVLLVLAPLAAAFFRDERLTAVILIASVEILMEALSSIPAALLERDLKVRVVTSIGAAGATVSAGTSVSLAVLGFAYWSLVLGGLASSATVLVLLWAFAGWRPTRRGNFAEMRKLISFGKYVTATSILGIIFLTVDNIVVARVFGLGVLGIYAIAFRFGNYPTTLVTPIVERVAYPLYVAVSEDRQLLLRTYCRILRYGSLVSFPTAVGLVLVAEPFVRGVLGDKWVDAILPLQVLAIYGLLRSLGVTAWQVFLALGRSDVPARIALVQTVGAAAGLVPATLGFGLVGVSVWMTLWVAFSTAYHWVWLWRLLGLNSMNLRWSLAGSTASTVVMAVVVYGTTVLVEFFGLFGSSPVARLVLSIVVGAVAYLGSIRLVLGRALFDQIRRDLARSAPEAAPGDASRLDGGR